MKRFVSLASATAVLLASMGAAHADPRPPTAMLWPFSAQTAAVASPNRACDTAAAVDGQPYFEMPTIAAEEGASGTTEVRIDLTASGNLASAQLFSSSGNAWLDAAALRSAHLSRFKAEVANCSALGGSYLYEVSF